MRKKFNIPYSKSFKNIRLIDMFLPKGRGNGRAILFIHGGGWKNGLRAQLYHTAEYMCRSGYVCGCCTYRLAPRHKFPKQVEDVRLAMAWLRSHAKKFGFSPDKIAVLGSSAGGHLACMLATISSKDKLGKTSELKNTNTRPNAVVCDCPVTDLAKFRNKKAGKAVGDFLGKARAGMAEIYRKASPVKRVTGNEPPFLLVHGKMDKLIPIEQSRSLAKALKKARVPVKLIAVPKLDHGFAFHKNYGKHLDIYRQTEKFLKHHLS